MAILQPRARNGTAGRTNTSIPDGAAAPAASSRSAIPDQPAAMASAKAAATAAVAGPPAPIAGRTRRRISA